MYAPKDSQGPIVPVRFDLNSNFTFSCGKDSACFTKCCRNIKIMLTPYDIIMMKKELGLTSDEFLFLFTEPGLIAATELPIPILKVMDEEIRACPFLKETGCSIYSVRPLTCRYYPLGAGIFHNRDASSDERFFAMIKEPHCLGHLSEREWTVREWIENQGINRYEEVNAGWVGLILKRKSLGPFVDISEKTLQMFFMACYNIDAFRRFVFESRFLDIYIVPKERQEEIIADDVSALDFGVKWLETTLLGSRNFSIRQYSTDAID
ncbi:MAG: YkgJ family cysteine cluster protein [Dissulfurimicrobium sp.]|uniref:YkgJ family cysteine cluster protein n=1 Tax=Dissulfurimicrobium TaxID=1769732 RepID=UPI001EDB7ABB|nr:YkgJ family cysteine cluster protein [Dissulfurimicrobium hydrothermale]UKL14316.1 YkgJ family cysteine cluster protein [Dissulfurimicrobium hydrothermale]